MTRLVARTKPLGAPVWVCSDCGHVNPPEAHFCQGDHQ